MESRTIAQMLIGVFVMALVIGGIITLLKGNGAEVLSSVQNILRFGR